MGYGIVSKNTAPTLTIDRPDYDRQCVRRRGRKRLLMHEKQAIINLFAVALLAIPGMAFASGPLFEVELEAGPVWQTKNDLQIPNDESATRFSLVDLIGNGPSTAGRLYLTWNINPRHGLRVLAAPFQIVETGTPESDLLFAGESFAAGEAVVATYKFNSWRLSYRYRIAQGDRSRWWIGFTAKIRDAEVKLRGNDVVGRDTDVGFVPLLAVSGEIGLTRRLRLLVDADGLAGGPGRAIDAAVKVGFDLSDEWRLTAGYRTLEGGADVDSVYSFAWLHYGAVSLVRRFGV